VADYQFSLVRDIDNVGRMVVPICALSTSAQRVHDYFDSASPKELNGRGADATQG
jgi:hypothetical protein